MLRTRIYTVLVLLPLLLAALFLASTPWWALMLAPLMLVGAWEWGALAGWRTVGRALYVGGIAAGGAALWHWEYASGTAGGRGAVVVLALSVLFWVLIVPWWLAQGRRVRSPAALAVTGAVLLLPLWSALVQLHAQPWLLLILMAIVWVSDTAAYFCGKRWGRRKLAPAISPGKTREGALGALVAVAVYYLVVSATGLAGPALLAGIVGLGVFLVLALLGIEGDLFESWIKRTAGVKDSGTLLPGHGGVLDRIDALTASMPAAALLLYGVM